MGELGSHESMKKKVLTYGANPPGLGAAPDREIVPSGWRP